MADDLTRALDRLDAGDWEGAHAMVQSADSAEAAWLHAHLHRVEGDEDNAAHWYRRAGRAPFEGTLDEERAVLRERRRR